MASNLCSELGRILHVDDDAKKLGIFVSYTISWLVEEKPFASYPFEDDVKNLLDYLKNRYTLDSLKNDAVVRAYRDFFWRIGIDPTKVRPASEALVRRGLRGSFPRISPVVDAGNIASAYTMVPIGMYDLAYASPPFRITISRGGEVFKPIGGGEERLGKGIPIFVDSKNLVMHIYPHRDSVETMIRNTTREVLIVGAGVPNVETNLVKKAVEIVAQLLEKIGWSWCRYIELK
ncbi:phenylalanine--tRNA ligase beta subunit-related protein [Ignisphaera sp. 4213-co]|uniref:Phenylalanine--tRNA ligase beta subunit-related protein n=1 Tax=Ignisphaera cupida TaxID=3050454 RepID=A0ABD4Z902_9CREN|nr:phenylalanine--tRNA ligase beta subunit-related protein [Ignisphaera sp. 4213-co]MDK6028765.1 phenylalanine--tRNA ligase beta subunit-related protein [Ignisphaera sp. 4213-co]